MGNRRKLVVIFSLLNLTVVIAVFPVGRSFAQEQKESLGRQMVRINSSPKNGIGPLIVHFEPIIKNLKEPLEFEWHFGDGTESYQRIPLPRHFESGRYVVLLKVRDKAANVFTASVTIKVDYPCG
jgi:hypothetical protein